MTCESRPLCALAPASWLPRLSSLPLGRVQAWKGSGRWDLRALPRDGTVSPSSRPEADAHWRGPEREVPAPVSLLPSRALFSHFLLCSPDGPELPLPPGILDGGTGERGTLRSQVSPECQVGIFWPLWGEEPIPLERPPPRRLPHPL